MPKKANPYEKRRRALLRCMIDNSSPHELEKSLAGAAKIISSEPDLFNRCLLINLEDSFLAKPVDTLIQEGSDKFSPLYSRYESHTIKHIAKTSGVSLETVEAFYAVGGNPKRGNPSQARQARKIPASDRELINKALIDSMEASINSYHGMITFSNYRAASLHLLDHVKQREAEGNICFYRRKLSGKPVMYTPAGSEKTPVGINTIFPTLLYFFAGHLDILPFDRAEILISNEAGVVGYRNPDIPITVLPTKAQTELIEAFDRLDAFYEQNPDITDAGQLLQAFIKPEGEPASASLFESTYATMTQAPLVNNFRLLSASPEIDIMRTGSAYISKASDKDFKAFIDDYTLIKKGLPTGAKKMLDTGCILLSNNGTRRAEEGSTIPTVVFISLEEYARSRGFDITPRSTSTPEEAAEEQKRIDSIMSNVRKKANAELRTLYALSLSDKERKKKSTVDYTDIRVLQGKGIRNGYIMMKFTEPMAKYLIAYSYPMFYPTKLLTLDERNPRTYNVGFYLSLHHGIDNNVTKGTNNIISVKNCLDAADEKWPTFEEIQASNDKGHWERRIKDPLEAILDTLQAKSILTSWEYCNAKKQPLTDEQLVKADYDTFMSLYILFDMPEKPDQTARLERKTERIKKAIRAQETKARKEKKKASTATAKNT